MGYKKSVAIEPKRWNGLCKPDRVLSTVALVLMLTMAATSCAGNQPASSEAPPGSGSSQIDQGKAQPGVGAAPAPKAKPVVPPSPTADPRLTAWKYEKPIANPLSASSGNAETSLGDVEKDLVKVSVPGNILDSAATVTISTPDKVPDIVAKEFAPGGAPISISAGDKEVRLSQPVSITMKIDSRQITTRTLPSDFWVTYFDGKDWEYLRPGVVDLKARTLTFSTYHFSLFGYGKISLDQRIEKYAHSKTLENMAQKTVDKYVEKAVEKTVEHILKDRLGIDDESTKSKILSSLANDDDYRDIYEKIMEGDVVGANQSLQVFAGKKIAENVEKSKLSKALGSLADKGVGYVESVAQASGYLAEGRYKDAGRILGGKIADQFLVTKVTKAAAEVIDYEIGQWKNGEIEAAYQAYKNGANGKFWGYNVDKGDFESLWDQMRGIGRQIELEEIKRVNRERSDTEPPQPPLTAAEEDKVRAKVQNDLKAKFQERAKNEAHAEEEQKALERLIKEFKDKSLLDPGMFGYKTELDVEQRLDLLLKLRDKILRDTGRTLNLGLKVTSDKQLALGDLILATYKWYEGRDAYAAFLKEKFGIDLYPTVQEIGGKWNTGSFVITEIYLDPVAAKEASSADKKAGDGCDLSILAALEKMKGQPLPMDIDMQVGKDGTGKMNTALSPDGKPGKPTLAQMKYSNGSISVSEVRPGQGTMNMEGEVIRTPRGLELRGTWKTILQSGGKDVGWMKGTWTATKDAPSAGTAVPVRKP